MPLQGQVSYDADGNPIQAKAPAPIQAPVSYDADGNPIQPSNQKAKQEAQPVPKVIAQPSKAAVAPAPVTAAPSVPKKQFQLPSSMFGPNQPFNPPAESTDIPILRPLHAMGEGPANLLFGSRNLLLGPKAAGGESRVTGAAQLLEGVLGLSTPALAAGFVRAPFQVAGGLIAGMGAQAAVDHVAEMLGIDSPWVRLMSDITGLAAGVASGAVLDYGRTGRVWFRNEGEKIGLGGGPEASSQYAEPVTPAETEAARARAARNPAPESVVEEQANAAADRLARRQAEAKARLVRGQKPAAKAPVTPLPVVHAAPTQVPETPAEPEVSVEPPKPKVTKPGTVEPALQGETVLGYLRRTGQSYETATAQVNKANGVKTPKPVLPEETHFEQQNPLVRRELRRMVWEMEEFQHKPGERLTGDEAAAAEGRAGFTQQSAVRGAFEAQNRFPNLKKGEAGAPVVHDLKLYPSSTGPAIRANLQKYIAGGKLNKQAIRAIDVAKQRLGLPTTVPNFGLAEPKYSPEWGVGDVPGEFYPEVRRTGRPEAALEEQVIRNLDRRRSSIADEYHAAFGNVFNSDNASELLGAHDPTLRWKNLLAVRGAASEVVQRLYQRAVTDKANPKDAVLILGGGTGSGKSSIGNFGLQDLEPLKATLDSTLSDPALSRRNIQMAIDAGRPVILDYIYRDPIEAWTDGVMKRFRDPNDQRPVTVRTHVSTHLNAPRTFLKLVDEFRTAPDFYYRVIDNTVKDNPVLQSEEWLHEQTNRYTSEGLTESINKIIAGERDITSDQATALGANAARAGLDTGASVRGPEGGGESGAGPAGAGGASDQVVPPKRASAFRLPKELAGAKPRYNYRDKAFTLEFSSDVDKAAYITAQPKPSSRDADYIQFLHDTMGWTDGESRQFGAQVRAAIKVKAKNAEPGLLKIRPVIKEVARAAAPVPVAPAVPEAIERKAPAPKAPAKVQAEVTPAMAREARAKDFDRKYDAHTVEWDLEKKLKVANPPSFSDFKAGYRAYLRSVDDPIITPEEFYKQLGGPPPDASLVLPPNPADLPVEDLQRYLDLRAKKKLTKAEQIELKAFEDQAQARLPGDAGDVRDVEVDHPPVAELPEQNFDLRAPEITQHTEANLFSPSNETFESVSQRLKDLDELASQRPLSRAQEMLREELRKDVAARSSGNGTDVEFMGLTSAARLVGKAAKEVGELPALARELALKTNAVYKDRIGVVLSTPEATRATDLVRGVKADIANREDVYRVRGYPDFKRFQAQSDPLNLALIGAYERTGKFPNPPNQPGLNDAFRLRFEASMKLAHTYLKRAFGEDTVGFIEHYVRHAFEFEDQVSANKATALLQGPIRGSLSANRTVLSRRMLAMPIDQALAKMQAAGIKVKAKTTNPELLRQWALNNAYRAWKFKVLGDDLKSQGLIEYVQTGKKAPKGWVPLEDRRFTVYFRPPGTKFLAKGGQYYGSTGVRRILDRAISRGFMDKFPYSIARDTNNAMNQMNLGFSAFHAMETALNSSISDVALAIRQARAGRVGPAALSLGRSAVPGLSMVKQYAAGAKLHKGLTGKVPVAPLGVNPSWFEKAARTSALIGKEISDRILPADRQAANIVRERMNPAGARLTMENRYRAHFLEKFHEAFANDKPLKGVAYSPLAFAQFIGAPLMEHLIPRVKVGAFLDLSAEIKAQMPNATPEALARAYALGWDSIDNRLGQLTYDNLMWHRAAVDVGQFMLRSLGWTHGTERELLGGMKDVVPSIFNAIKTKSLPKITDRMAYTMALPAYMAMAGGIYQLAHTGQWPHGRDYYYPKNGLTDANGNPDRVVVKSYMSDLVSGYHAPGTTLIHKLSPFLSYTGDMLVNQNYFGDLIWDPNAPAAQKLQEMGAHTWGAWAPLVVNQYRGLSDEGQPIEQSLERFGGVQKAPAWIIQSDYQKQVESALQQKLGQRHRTPVEVQNDKLKGQVRTEIRAALAAKKPIDLSKSLAWAELLRRGAFATPQSRVDFIQTASMTGLQRAAHALSLQQRAKLLHPEMGR